MGDNSHMLKPAYVSESAGNNKAQRDSTADVTEHTIMPREPA